MNENKNITAAAAEETIESIKKLMEAIGNDNELKAKLEETLAALTGKAEETKQEQTAESAEDNKSEDIEKEEDDSKEDNDSEEQKAAEEIDVEDEEDDEDDGKSSGTDFSEIFNDDAIAGLIVGFAAGAAVVGGGVLLHKLLK